jgi:ribose transport system substrate-binding protein
MELSKSCENRRNLVVGYALGVLASFFALHCAHAETRSPHQITIALVPGIVDDPFYITMENGAMAEAKKLGIKLLWDGGTSFSPTTQIPVLQTLLAEHPDALLIAPTSDIAMVNPIKQYVDAHIPVITVDTTSQQQSLLASRITCNSFQGGVAAAKTIAAASHGKGEVAVINFEAGVSTADQRQEGFLAEIKKYPDMKTVAVEYDDNSPTKAFTDAQLLMLRYPHLVGIFGTNLFSAEGAGKAVAASGKVGQVIVVGYDSEPDEVAFLKKGIISALVIQQPAQEGMLAVKYAYEALTKHDAEIPKSVEIPNVIATTKNADNPAISQYFYKTTLAN